MKSIPYSNLSKANLIIDAVYESDRSNNTYKGDPLVKLIPGVSNQSGFRRKPNKDGQLIGLVLFSTGANIDWPDELDPYTGTYTYFGDNRQPGRELHNTDKKGNLELSKLFALAHGSAEERAKCPLILIFHSGEKGRDVVFKGLAVPGTSYLSRGDDLIAIWRVAKNERFQNYKAFFTILDTGEISGDWVREVFANRALDLNDTRVPKAFLEWVKSRKYIALVAERDKQGRSIKEQLPEEGIQTELVQCIIKYCEDDPFRFEPIAAAIWKLSCLQPMEYEMTRRFRDGGRDAIGHLTLGPLNDPINITFALEAKCYAFSNRVGVKETSRLISRIKQREFGVIVTTSGVDSQAYKEIRQDGHPIVIISGKDIAQTLIKCGINDQEKCKNWMYSISI